MTSGECSAETIAVQAGHLIDSAIGSLMPQIQPSATPPGGAESSVEQRANIEGPESHMPENLPRLSTGIEDVYELVGDLEQMLSCVS